MSSRSRFPGENHQPLRRARRQQRRQPFQSNFRATRSSTKRRKRSKSSRTPSCIPPTTTGSTSSSRSTPTPSSINGRRSIITPAKAQAGVVDLVMGNRKFNSSGTNEYPKESDESNPQANPRSGPQRPLPAFLAGGADAGGQSTGEAALAAAIRTRSNGLPEMVLKTLKPLRSSVQMRFVLMVAPSRMSVASPKSIGVSAYFCMSATAQCSISSSQHSNIRVSVSSKKSTRRSAPAGSRLR